MPSVVRGDSWEGISSLRRSLRSETGESWTASASADTLTSAGHGKSNGDRYMVTTAAAGLVTGQVYHVINATTDTIQLSEEAGGSAVNLTADASVTLYAVTAPAAAVASAKLHFRLGSKRGSSQLELTSASGGGLTINDADEWIFSVAARAAGFSRAGTLYWDLEVTDADGSVVTPIEGTLEVLDDVSRD